MYVCAIKTSMDDAVGKGSCSRRLCCGSEAKGIVTAAALRCGGCVEEGQRNSEGSMCLCNITFETIDCTREMKRGAARADGKAFTVIAASENSRDGCTGESRQCGRVTR